MDTRRWRQQFPSHFRIPSVIHRRVEAGLLEDISYGNDVAPSFSIVGASTQEQIDNGAEWRVFVDHPVEDYRELMGPRYAVAGPTDDESGNVEEYFETDNFHDVIDYVRKNLEVNLAMQDRRLPDAVADIAIEIFVTELWPDDDTVRTAEMHLQSGILGLYASAVDIEDALDITTDAAQTWVYELANDLDADGKVTLVTNLPITAPATGATSDGLVVNITYAVEFSPRSYVLPEDFNKAAEEAGAHVPR